MICHKCGKEYEDDMPNCLWCDAPNLQHPANKGKQFTEAPAQSISTEPTETEATEAHPAGLFMWSAAIFAACNLGYLYIAILITFFHKKALQENKALGRFFVGMLIASIGLYFITAPVIGTICRSLLKINELNGGHSSSTILLALSALYPITQGFIGAKLLKFYTPDYKPEDYRKKSIVGVITAIVLFIICALCGFYTDIAQNGTQFTQILMKKY
ncbi:hypothetical protein [Fibrobacter succinogenes]|uniref:Uncharacterized protein n=1 Tax=Fibrobacter succinogenes TaxID=833 RepID=A0A380RX25_FIBSU|nr:hypothetical protein [Fibrobacter succinogenes]PWJ37604.1 hypothetical protein IE02_1095 [Fibrobacter succinogenes subsp. elongatus]SUQ19851.1 hypothetical protein SAMN05661053_1095 [Fibrobacter succinogenes]